MSAWLWVVAIIGCVLAGLFILLLLGLYASGLARAGRPRRYYDELGERPTSVPLHEPAGRPKSVIGRASGVPAARHL